MELKRRGFDLQREAGSSEIGAISYRNFAWKRSDERSFALKRPDPALLLFVIVNSKCFKLEPACVCKCVCVIFT